MASSWLAITLAWSLNRSSKRTVCPSWLVWMKFPTLSQTKHNEIVTAKNHKNTSSHQGAFLQSKQCDPCGRARVPPSQATMFFHIFSGAFSWSYLGVLVLKILSHLGLGEVWISVGNCGCQWMLSCELWPSTNFLPEVDLTWHFNNQLPFAIVCSNVCRPATWNSKCLASHYTCHLQPAYVYSAIVPLWFSFVSGSAFSHVTCPTLLLANWRQDSHSAYTCVLHSQLASHPPCQAAAEEPLKPFALHCLIAPTPPLPLLKDPSRMKVYRCHISEQLGQYTCLYSILALYGPKPKHGHWHSEPFKHKFSGSPASHNGQSELLTL